jgi:hypothetical protein
MVLVVRSARRPLVSRLGGGWRGGFHNRLKYTNPGEVSASRDARGRWVYKINRLRRVFRRGVAGGDADGDSEPRGP